MQWQQMTSCIRPAARQHLSCLAATARLSSTSSNARWKQRQSRDPFAREARVLGLKSRAAFKLLELDSKHNIFRAGQYVVDLGFAPGSWSQVAHERTQPRGHVIGIDLLPATPPRGVATFQGDVLSPRVRNIVIKYIASLKELSTIKSPSFHRAESNLGTTADEVNGKDHCVDISNSPRTENSWLEDEDYAKDDLLVDVVLSDMLMNTSGISFRDHVGSMDLCTAALQFANSTLRPGGCFICKFFQGPEDKNFEADLRRLFAVVSREKPSSSRSDSREAYFVALRRREKCDL